MWQGAGQYPTWKEYFPVPRRAVGHREGLRLAQRVEALIHAVDVVRVLFRMPGRQFEPVNALPLPMSEVHLRPVVHVGHNGGGCFLDRGRLQGGARTSVHPSQWNAPVFRDPCLAQVLVQPLLVVPRRVYCGQLGRGRGVGATFSTPTPPPASCTPRPRFVVRAGSDWGGPGLPSGLVRGSARRRVGFVRGEGGGGVRRAGLGKAWFGGG